MLPVPAIPTFVVAGQPNEGKTTVLATLAEDDRAEIGPAPGTTLHCTPYPVELDDSQIMVFIDTPGFQEPAAALEWFRAQPTENQSAAAFLDQHRSPDQFPAEREILQPLARGAAVIYVVDASRPVRESDRQEIEILRLCGNPRIAVMYRKEAAQDFRPDWTRVLARDFNLRREFDSHQATFRERIELLEAAKTVIQEWQPAMDRAILALRDDWDLRLRRAATELCQFLRDAINLRQREPIDPERNPDHAADRAKTHLQQAVRNRELEFRRRIRQLFRHRRDNWALPDLVLTDLFSDQVWRCLGLTKRQLVAAGAAVGAAAGGTIDVAVGGHSFLLGAIVGAASGAVLSWLSANRAVQVQLPRLRWGPIRFGGHPLGGIHAEASVDPRSNLIWILIDRAWVYLEAASSWSHGRRQDPIPIAAVTDEKQGLTARLTTTERGLIIRFIRLLRKPGGNPANLDAAERDVRDLWLRLLRVRTGVPNAGSSTG
jgi:hypothetical protein